MTPKFLVAVFSLLPICSALPVANLSIVNLETDLQSCCHFPSGFHDAIGGHSFDNSGGLKKSETLGYEFGHEIGNAISVSASSGKAFIDCDPGTKIKGALGVCGMLPINDNSKWNALGFEMPSLELHFFGITLDVAGLLMDKAMDSLPSSWSSDQKAAADAATKRDVGGDGGDGGESGGLQNDEVMGAGACIAFQKHDCGMGFAIAQSGLLKAVCAIAGQALYCGPDLPASGPKIELMLLAVGFSPMRDLQFTTELGIWNGAGSIHSALEANQLTSKGVISMTGLMGLKAFDFSIGISDVEVGMEMVGSIIFDVKLPNPQAGLSQIQNLFKTLVGGDFNKLLGAGAKTAEAIIPPFQVTIEGSTGFVVELAPGFEFEFTVGQAVMTMGYNMEGDYPGLSNGVYLSALQKICLDDIIPPLKTGLFQCNGKPVFDKTCITAKAGLYLSLAKGMGFSTYFEFSLIGGNKMTWAADMNVGTDTKGEFKLAGSLDAQIGGSKVSLDARVGFTFALKNPTFKVFAGASFPNPLSVLKGLGLAVPKLTAKFVKIIKGWVGLEELQMPNGRNIASRKLLSKVTTATATDDAGTAFAEIEEAEAVGGRRRRRRWHRWHAHVPHRHHIHVPHVHVPHRHHIHVPHVHVPHRHHIHVPHVHVPHRHHIHVPHVHVPHRHHIHVPHLHIPIPFEDTSVTLKFSDLSASADMCGFRMRFKMKVGAKIFGFGKSTSVYVNVVYKAGELIDNIVDEAAKVFSKVKKAFV